ncbi:unnamed protein product [Acanthosepion pharaonis]|uniref:Uncharacterized protein n=1 Tax=Acanthosepion pharaonis TaxID=158019 RepID=A0A812DN99_ACAPH|nr:unnamed protein product [Sepia pharaonis]
MEEVLRYESHHRRPLSFALSLSLSISDIFYKLELHVTQTLFCLYLVPFHLPNCASASGLVRLGGETPGENPRGFLEIKFTAWAREFTVESTQRPASSYLPCRCRRRIRSGTGDLRGLVPGRPIQRRGALALRTFPTLMCKSSFILSAVTDTVRVRLYSYLNAGLTNFFFCPNTDDMSRIKQRDATPSGYDLNHSVVSLHNTNPQTSFDEYFRYRFIPDSLSPDLNHANTKAESILTSISRTPQFRAKLSSFIAQLLVTDMHSLALLSQPSCIFRLDTPSPERHPPAMLLASYHMTPFPTFGTYRLPLTA